MALTSDSITLVAGALALVVGTIIAFGYRCGDKSSKFDEKSQTDELNDIRMAMRADDTVAALDRLWQFLLEAKEDLENSGKIMYVPNLLSDSVYREQFNKLINDIEHTFTESANVKQAWIALKRDYSLLGKILYAYAATVGSVSFLVLALSSSAFPSMSTNSLIVLWIFVAILGATFLLPIMYTYTKIISNKKIYDEKRTKIRVDEVRIN